jgi:hypothetical protein
MSERMFVGASTLEADRLALALAPARVPGGLDTDPSFFHGFATHPVVVAQGLLALADVTGTRYFQFTPASQRDPVLTANRDRLRAEVFSACNGVYARLDVLGSGLDGGEIGTGTTNVDINLPTRTALGRVRRTDLLHLDVGAGGLRASTMAAMAVERPVDMPDRWVRALGNAAHLHHGAQPVFTLDRTRARRFIATLPHATARAERGWVVADRTGARLSRREVSDGVSVHGINRLDVLRRLMIHVDGLTAYRAIVSDGGDGAPSVFEVALPGARLTLGLTSEPWRGFSGEGSLLAALSGDQVLDDAAMLSVLLAFDKVIDVARLAREADIGADRTAGALAVLAASGRVGWDAHEDRWFHRELPDDPNRIERDNPRLRAARKLVAEHAVTHEHDDVWTVSEYRVHLNPAVAQSRCTCTWYLRHGGDRGPCKHVVAARIAAGMSPDDPTQGGRP